MDSKTIDELSAARIAHYLITPYSQWDAFKLGIIDRDGKQVRRELPSEGQKFNNFHKIIIRLRNYLKNTPGYSKYIQAYNAGDVFYGTPTPAANFSAWSVSNKVILPAVKATYNSMREWVESEEDDIESVVTLFAFHEGLLSEDSDVILEEFAGTGVAGFAGIPPTDQEPPVSKVAQKKHTKRASVGFKEWRRKRNEG